MKRTNRVYPQSYVSAATGNQSQLTAKKIGKQIEDEVANRDIFGWWANPKGNQLNYYLEYFRTKDAWMNENTANALSEQVAQVIDDLGFADKAHVEVIPAGKNSMTDKYGYECYFVRVVVPKAAMLYYR